MRHNSLSLGFFVLLLTFINASNSPLESVENSPIFKVMLTQMKLSEEKDQSGFDKILGLLTTLIDTTKANVAAWEKEEKSLALNCTVQNGSLTISHSKLLAMRNTYSKQLKALVPPKDINQQIANLTKQKALAQKERDIYVAQYKKVASNWAEFQILIKKAFAETDTLYNDVQKIYLSTLKVQLKDSEKTLIGFVKDDTRYVYGRLKTIIEKIVEFDDTEPCIYREQLEKNIRRWTPSSKDFIIGVNASLEINVTLNNFNKYYVNRMANFSNANKTIFTYDNKILSLTSLINNYVNNHKKNYETIRNNLLALIKVNEQSIKTSANLIAITLKQCRENIANLVTKITSGNSEFESYTKLKLYFMNNYGQIAASMRNKYHGNINVGVLKQQTASKPVAQAAATVPKAAAAKLKK